MKQFTVTAAIIAFFALALIGWASGLSMFQCGIRAVAGSVVIYLLATLAIRMVISVMVDTIVAEKSQQREAEEEPGSE